MKKSQFLSLCLVIIAAPHASWDVMQWVCLAVMVASWIMAWRGE